MYKLIQMTWSWLSSWLQFLFQLWKSHDSTTFINIFQKTNFNNLQGLVEKYVIFEDKTNILTSPFHNQFPRLIIHWFYMTYHNYSLQFVCGSSKLIPMGNLWWVTNREISVLITHCCKCLQWDLKPTCAGEWLRKKYY